MHVGLQYGKELSVKNRILIIAVVVLIIAAAAVLLLRKKGGKVELKEMRSASELFNQAIGLEAQGEWLAAKKDLQKLIEEFSNFR